MNESIESENIQGQKALFDLKRNQNVLSRTVGFEELNKDFAPLPNEDKKGFFIRKEGKVSGMDESLPISPPSPDHTQMNKYNTNKTQKKEFGKCDNFFNNTVGMRASYTPQISRMISRENQDLPRQTAGPTFGENKSNRMRRSVQQKVRKNLGSSVNIGFKSSSKNIEFDSPNHLEKNLQKIQKSRQKALDSLSHHSSRTSDIQQRMRQKFRTNKQRRASKSRGLSRENRLSRRKSIMTRSPKSNIKLNFKPRAHSRVGSINSLSNSIRATLPGKVATAKNSQSMMVEGTAKNRLGQNDKSRTNTSIFGDFMDGQKENKTSERSRENKRGTILSRNVDVIKRQSIPPTSTDPIQSPPNESTTVETQVKSEPKVCRVQNNLAVVELEQKVKKLEQEKKEAQEMVEFYKIQNSEGEESTSSQVELLEGELEEMRYEIEQLKVELKEEKELNSKLINNKAELMKKKEEMKQQFEEIIEKKRISFEETEEQWKKQLNQLEEELNKLRRKHEAEEFVHDKPNWDEMTPADQIRKLKAKVRVLQKEKEFLIQEKKRLSKEMLHLEEFSSGSIQKEEEGKKRNELELELRNMENKLKKIEEKSMFKDNKLEELRSKVSSIESENLKMQTKIQRQEEEFQKDLSREEFKFKEKELEVQGLLLQIEDLKNQKANKENKVKIEMGEKLEKEDAFQNRINLLKNQIGHLEEEGKIEKSQYEQKLDEKAIEIKEISLENSELVKRISILKKEKEELEGSCNEKKKKTELIIKSIEKIENQKSTLLEKLSKKQEIVEKLQLEINDYKSKLKETESTINDLKSINSEQLNKIKEIREQLDKDQNELLARTQKIKDLHEDLRDKESRLESVEKELAELKSKLKAESEELEDQTELLQYENDKLKKNSKMMELKIASLKSTEKALTKNQQMMEKTIQSLEKKTEHTESLEKEREEMKTNLDRLKDSKKLLEKDVQKSMMKIGKALELLNSLKLNSKQKDNLMNVLVSG